MTAVFILCRVLLYAVCTVAVCGGFVSVWVQWRREQRGHLDGYGPIVSAPCGNLSGRRK